MRSRHQHSYSAATLAIFAALALLLPFAGCGPVAGPYLLTGLDSADTGAPGERYDDVKGLPSCKWGWVRLPPSSDEVNRTFDGYSYADVHQLVYGDAGWSDAPATLYPVVYRTFAQDEYPVGWEVYGVVSDQGYFWEVTYAPFNGWDESTQPFTLACAASAL